MDSNKLMNLSIGKLVIILILVGLMVTGGSYAYWMWSSNVNKNVVFNTISGLEDYIIYDEGESYFVGNFQPTDKFCQNVNNTISFKKTSEVSELAFLATIYMDINSIGENIGKSNDVYWVVTSGDNSISCEDGLDTEAVLAAGTFYDVKSEDTIKLLDRIFVTEEFKQFTVWMWINSAGTDLSNLSGETIDTNIWTEFMMYDERGTEIIVNFEFANETLDIKQLYAESGEYIFTVPYDGNYQLEVWGAQGGESVAKSGYGGYSVGTIQLVKGDNLYVNVGGKGTVASASTTFVAGGYNGGGSANASAGSGGGATHIATIGGSLSTFFSNVDSVLIVSGGGGGGGVLHSTVAGGSGGGILGVDGGNYNSTYLGGGHGGTQTTGGTVGSGTVAGKAGVFGSGGHGGYNSEYSQGSGGGGGGWYGGGGGSNRDGGGGGGSGYIGNSLLKNKYMYCYNCSTSSEYSTLTYTTTNVSSEPIANYAKSGDGAARITALTSDKIVNKIVNYGVAYGELPVPVKDDYEFSGWYTKEGVLVTKDTIVSNKEDHTLYAKWEKTYIINFDASGGGSVDMNEELIKYTIPAEYEFVAPYTGQYQLEVWGAQGGIVVGGAYGGLTSSITPGYGGYSTGKVELLKGQTIYLNVGGSGTDNCVSPSNGVIVKCPGGYNGGGSGYSSDCYRYTGGGGGATHIANISGQLSTLSSNNVLIVAGGGGGSGYYSYSGPTKGYGGSGGGNTGNAGNINGSTSIISAGGTQTSGNAFGVGQTPSTSTSNQGFAGGGGGYYGGSSGTANSIGAGGGSGYIGNSLLTDKSMYCYNCKTSNEESTLTYTTTNVSSEPVSNYAKIGDGAIKIIALSSKKMIYGREYGELPTPIREGYTFLGWFTELDGGVEITSDTIFNGTSDQTLYAHWSAN